MCIGKNQELPITFKDVQETELIHLEFYTLQINKYIY